MKKIKTILIVLLLAIVSLFGFVGCESSSQSELQSKIDELQSRIEELEEQIRERDERIKELEKENVGTLYTLQEAYDNGYLTKEDLEQIAYYHNDRKSYPQTLDEAIAEKIKETAASERRRQDKYLSDKAKAEDFVLVKYYGNYNGSYTVMMNEPYDEYPADIRDVWEDIDGVRIHYTSYGDIVVWREKV